MVYWILLLSFFVGILAPHVKAKGEIHSDSTEDWVLQGSGWVRGPRGLHYVSVSFGDAFGGDLGWGNYTYTLDIEPREYASPYALIRVFCRMTGPWEGYCLNIGPRSMNLVRCDGSWETTLPLGSAAMGIPEGERSQVKLMVVENEIQVTLDEELIIRAIDPDAMYPMGFVGLRSDHSLFTLHSLSVNGDRVQGPYLEQLANMGLGREIKLPAGKFMAAGCSKAGGARNIVRIDDHSDGGRWACEDALGYVGYLGTDGVFFDWLFDTLLFAAPSAPTQARPTLQREWSRWLDHVFSPQGGLHAFDQAVAIGQECMEDPDYMAKVILMIPYPLTEVRDFGCIEENILSLDFGGPNGAQHRLEAVLWYLKEALARWQSSGFKNLDLIGFSWSAEAVQPGDPPLLKQTGEALHRLGYRFFWLPSFKAIGYDRWQTYGIDAAINHSNYMCNPEALRTRFPTTVSDALKYGMGIGIEADASVLSSQSGRERYLDYLRAGVEYGYDGPVLRAFRQGFNVFNCLMRSPEPELRSLYDATYQFLQGEFPDGFSSSHAKGPQALRE